MKGLVLFFACAGALAVSITLAGASASRGECLERLDRIENGKLSADDQPTLEQCVIAGHVTGDQISRAYEAAKRAKK